MSKAILLTAFDRPNYLRRVLASWWHVRELKDWHVLAMVEPGTYSDQIRELLESFAEAKQHPSFEVQVNPVRYGVLHHPWVGFENLFAQKHDFVVRAEDDLRVSDDILEYFSWAAETFEPRDDVATVHAYSRTVGDPNEVEVRTGFNPWVWGTWRGVWDGLIGPTWDHDYSTFNGTPGNQSGWDWNLDTRVLPEYSLKGVYPMTSRVDNIGIHGTHATPENHETSVSYAEHYGERRYRLAERG